MVLMHYSIMPISNLIGLSAIGKEYRLFLIPENHQRKAAGGAVDSQASHLETLVSALRPQVG